MSYDDQRTLVPGETTLVPGIDNLVLEARASNCCDSPAEPNTGCRMHVEEYMRNSVAQACAQMSGAQACAQISGAQMSSAQIPDAQIPDAQIAAAQADSETKSSSETITDGKEDDASDIKNLRDMNERLSSFDIEISDSEDESWQKTVFG